MSPRREIDVVLGELADRQSPRTEATVQAAVRELLLSAPLDLADHQVELESQAGDLRRIDVQVGFTVIEVKRDLRPSGVRSQALSQLAGYVHARSTLLGQRYVGVLTDGAEWTAYHLRGEVLVEVSSVTVSAARPDIDEFLLWLEGVLATAQGVVPTPEAVARRLGARSSSHSLDRATLAALFADFGDLPSVQLKRELWAKLLTTALGTQFDGSDELFIEHTLLVNSAEIIAHALLGFDVGSLPPASLLSGARFAHAQISGVVEDDFFDWVLEVPGGEAFVRTLARRLARFAWERVDHDVLKVLYESIISAQTRKKLGEYYTPDWLAEHMVATVVEAPLEQRVLDPACGSGTFLFHAVRRYLDAARDDGRPLAEALEALTNTVIGVDVHPVAVTLARVTYLLAVGRDRLNDPTRGPVTVPVYLGDTVQWSQRLDLHTAEHIIVRTDDQAELFASELAFPQRLLADAARFDQLVNTLADLAAKPRSQGHVPSLSAVFRLLGIPEREQGTIAATFATMCRLHDEGRDHIWGYYVRNLARPAWLARTDNRVDVLIGNPPWLAYRHMPAEMQTAFRATSKARGLWHGATVATHQDLSGLFVARTVQLYLRPGGRFAYVMPNAAIDRGQFAGFRSGIYPEPGEHLEVAFEQPWDLRRLRPHFFPRAASVVFGARRPRGEYGAVMPVVAERWTGRLPAGDPQWPDVASAVTREPAQLRVSNPDDDIESAYRARFSQGASVVPRMLFLVEERPPGPLGLASGRRAVRSARSNYEKPPWKDEPSLEGVLEEEFIRPMYLGENVLPYRLLPARPTVLPIEGTRLLDGSSGRLDLYPGLAEWWRAAEEVWQRLRSSDRLSLVEQLDYRRKLTAQLPADRQRIVYTASGMHVAAAPVTDPAVVIEHALYWATAMGEEEGHYLCAILNSPVTTQLVRPLMSYGKDERHIDKYVWQLPIPQYDPDLEDLRELARLGKEAEELIATVEIDETRHFPTLRRQLRKVLAESEVGQEIDERVTQLLSR